MYKLNISNAVDENGETHKTYGITFKNRIIKDISINKNKVKKLVNICNRLKVSPLHIDDVIEDFLVDFTI